MQKPASKTQVVVRSISEPLTFNRVSLYARGNGEFDVHVQHVKMEINPTGIKIFPYIDEKNWVASEQGLEIPWGDLRDLQDDSLDKLEHGMNVSFIANLQPGIGDRIVKVSIWAKELDPETFGDLGVQVLREAARDVVADPQALSALKKVFMELPPETRMPKCSACGGAVDGSACKDCGTTLATQRRRKGVGTLVAGLCGFMAAVGGGVLVGEYVSKAAARYILFFGGAGGIVAIYRGIKSIISGK